MKQHHGAVASAALTLVGLLGLGVAGYGVTTGNTPCSLLGTCTTETTAAVAVADSCETTACEKPAEVELVSDTKDCSAGSCDAPATAVADTKDCSDCTKSDAAVKLVGNTKDCSDCPDEATTVAAKDAGCAAGACEAKATAVADGQACADGAACAAAGIPVAVGSFNNACPLSGEAIDDTSEFVSSYHGMNVSFCCEMCQKKFDKSDDAKQMKYVSNVVKPINETCCGKPADASTMTVAYGYPIAFCGEKCADWFANAPADKQIAHVASLTKPVNETCPMSGKPINVNAVAFHHGKAIGFCGPGCAKHFNASSDAEKDAVLAKYVADASGKASECGEGCEKDCCKPDA